MLTACLTLKSTFNDIDVIATCSSTTASGEPPSYLSSSVVFAIKRAIESDQADAENFGFYALCHYTVYIIM